MSAGKVEEWLLLEIRRKAKELVAKAAAVGVVVTVELVSYEPLAMGNTEMAVEVRPARGFY